MFRKTSVGLGLVGSLLWLSSVVAAPPQLNIDNPSEGQHTSGLFSILGWAVGITAPIDFVEVSFDGGPPVPVGYGGGRGDVGAAFPEIPDAGLSGWALGFNARLLTNGIHRMTARAVDMNGEEASRSVSFLVSNMPGEENPRNIGLDLSRATLRIAAPRDLLVQGLDINGQSLTSVLSYDPPSNTFVLISFVADEDDDGFRDDDANFDGFADNDADRDGFPDDDLNRNGLSDSLENINGNGNVNGNGNGNRNTNGNVNGNYNGNANANANGNGNGNRNRNANEDEEDEDEDEDRD